MRISYDAEVDAMYIRLVEGVHECRTLHLTDEISLNIGKDELLVGIEILSATAILGKDGERPTLLLDNLQVATA